MIDLRLGDCLSVMAELPENSVDTILTDPPYGLTFMGKDWDRGVPGVAFWREALRVAKPGAMLLAMGGTRTFHRLVVAIEDAGWEIRDAIDYLHDGIPVIHPFAWLYGSGFPKSYDISKGMDKAQGEEGKIIGTKRAGYGKRNGKTDAEGSVFLNSLPEDLKQVPITAPSTPAAQLWHGWGTALKPAMELICVAMKPIDGTYVNNALTWGVAGLWIDGGRVKTDEVKEATSIQSDKGYWHNASGGVPRINGNGTDNPQGRFPANVIHDGSDEVTALFPQTVSRAGNPNRRNHKPNGNTYFSDKTVGQEHNDSGSAARFFYCAKASRSERNAGLEGMEAKSAENITGRKSNTVGLTTNNRGDESGNPFCGVSMTPRQNHHPTVKPLALMRYLARLTKTPTGGIVLDPFMGSGTTGMAAVLEGRDFIGIELNAEYLEIAEKRIAHAQGSIEVELPLFAEVEQ